MGVCASNLQYQSVSETNINIEPLMMLKNLRFESV